MPNERLVQRHFGSEIEYPYTFADPSKNHKDAQIDYRGPKRIKHLGQYLENGSRFYVDIGLIEYATPECRTLEDLVTHELAGEKIVFDTYGGEGSKLTSIHKRAYSPYVIHPAKGYGAHENYSTSIDIKGESFQYIRDSLGIHFATRTIFIGAGYPTPDGFRIGQKIEDISEEDGQNSTHSKALVNTRTEHLDGNSHEMKRLHVVSGDANMSPWAIRMKFGTTSLMLRLLEHEVPVHDLFLASPLASAKLVAAGVDGITIPLQLRSQKAYSAVNIQEELASRSFALSERIELPKEERKVIDDWFTIIDALKHYAETGEHQRELKELDWYTKKQIVDGRRTKEAHQGLDREEQIKEISQWDKQYDDIEKGWGVGLRKKGRFSDNPEDAAVQEAMTTPPEGRAKMRSALIKKAYEISRSSGYYNIDWEKIYRARGALLGHMPIDGDYSDEAIQQKADEWISAA